MKEWTQEEWDKKYDSARINHMWQAESEMKCPVCGGVLCVSNNVRFMKAGGDRPVACFNGCHFVGSYEVK